MRTNEVAGLLDAQQLLEDDLAKGDQRAHHRVTAVFAGLDEHTILSVGAPLGRLYRWLDTGERQRLQTSCQVWAVFEPLRTRMI